MYYLIKIVLSAVILVTVSEVAKRSSVFGALIASLPLTSLLAIIWMRFDKVETAKISALSHSIFYLVIPSLFFFLLFPVFLNRGINFWISMSMAVAITILLYFIMLWVLRMMGVGV